MTRDEADFSLTGRLDSFIENAPNAAAMLDRDLRYVAVSWRWLRDYKIAGRIIGRSHYEVLPDIPERWREAYRRALAGETLSAESDSFERADGTIQWLRWEVRPWRLPDGDVGGIVIFTRDVTAMRAAEREIVEREAHVRSILDTV
ncbi:MAG TPA: PAS domain-containing protein, partial [Roseiarcus sp.]|nr:PAS domain-containing protein [Roseiarcus sp.]